MYLVNTHVHMAQCVCVGQRPTCGSYLFSLCGLGESNLGHLSWYYVPLSAEQDPMVAAP